MKALLILVTTLALAQAPSLQRGLAARNRGDLAAADAEFSRVVAAYERGTLKDAAQIADAADAYAMLGKMKEARDTFDVAIKRNPNSADIRYRLGKLFHKTFDDASAMKWFEDAVKIDPRNAAVLTSIAEIRSDQWDGGADQLVAEALEADPKYIPAMVLQARHALEDEKPDAAEKIVNAALAINKDSLEALTMNAGVAYVRGDKAETERRVDAVLKINPHYGEVYARLAHLAEIHRQFTEARDLLLKATAKDPTLWTAYSDLGITYLRLGDDDSARAALETSYKGDPYNPWTVNTLRLMDSYVNFVQFETPNFRVKLHTKEAGELRPYVEELLERALAEFVKEYGYKPPAKVSFEMFPDHPDFEVRTLGVPGLGALGASFGMVVAMDSPSGRAIGEFHWGSTLWHELAHVVTLGATNNRIPRWFTEGLSVYEEWRAGWGDRLEVDSIKQMQQDKLMKIADLNKGYIRPTYPGQVQFAYFEGGMLVRFLVEKYGFDKIRAMMAGYKDGGENVAVLEKVIGKKSTELDVEFRAWLDQKVGSMVKAVDLKWQKATPRPDLEAEIAKNPANFFAQIQLAHLMAKAGEKDQALAHAMQSTRLFPEFTGDGNGYELAALILNEKGDKEAAAAQLQKWVDAGGLDPNPAKKLADLDVELKHPEAAAKVLESFLYIAPQDIAIHNQLGAIDMDLKRTDGAIREYTVALAMTPVDPAASHYNLARAFAQAHRTKDAKRETMAALEIAPGYSPAQKLLLQLTDNEESHEP